MASAPISTSDFTDTVYCVIPMGLSCIYTWVGTVSLWCTVFCYKTFTIFKNSDEKYVCHPCAGDSTDDGYSYPKHVANFTLLNILLCFDWTIIFVILQHNGMAIKKKKISTCLSQLIPSCTFLSNFKTQLLITNPPILRQIYYISLSHEQINVTAPLAWLAWDLWLCLKQVGGFKFSFPS